MVKNKERRIAPAPSAEADGAFDQAARDIEAELPDLRRRSKRGLQRFEKAATGYLRKAGGIDLGEAVASLKLAREKQGMTLAQVSEATGITVPTLSKLENGRHANPTVKTLRRYASAVGKKLVVRLEDES